MVHWFRPNSIIGCISVDALVDVQVLNLQTASQVCRNVGLCIGGTLSSISLDAFQFSGCTMNPTRLGTVPVMFLIVLVLLVLMVNVFFVPNSFAPKSPFLQKVPRDLHWRTFLAVLAVRPQHQWQVKRKNPISDSREPFTCRRFCTTLSGLSQLHPLKRPQL